MSGTQQLAAAAVSASVIGAALPVAGAALLGQRSSVPQQP
jgi:uncharacterized membrane protein YfbV (UPF0208 family)